MTRRQSSSGLAGALLLGLGCHAEYVCDVDSANVSCQPLALRCSLDTSQSGADSRIDLGGPFSLFAEGLVARLLNGQQPSPAVSIKLDFIDGDKPSTGWLAANLLPASQDNELRLELTAEAKKSLTPRRGGAASIHVKLGRWTGELAVQNENEKSSSCSFVIEPKFTTSQGRFEAPRQGLSQLGAKLTTGPRVDCTGAAGPSCSRSGALYASYFAMEPAMLLLQLERFVYDQKSGQLTSDPSLPAGFRVIPPSDRQVGSAVVATPTQLVLRSSSTKLSAVPATAFSPRTILTLPPPLLMHDGIGGSFEKERILVPSGQKLLGYSLVSGVPAATQQGEVDFMLTLPFRLFSSAQRLWPGFPAPDAVVLGDQRELRLACLDQPTACSDSLGASAQLQIGTSAFTEQGAGAADLDPVLADLDADGRLDLVVLNRKTQVVSFMPQLLNRTFDTPRALSGVPPAQAFAIADMDGDGLLDILFLAPGAGTVDLSGLLNQALPPNTVP